MKSWSSVAVSSSCSEMGGFGSGRSGRRSRHARVEDLSTLDVRDLRDAGLLEEVGTSLERAKLSLSWNGIEAILHISRTAQPFGGFRWWLHCPRCHGRNTKLYVWRAASSPISCRTCYGLRYTSQSLGLADRWQHRAATFYKQAGCNMYDSFHYKPKGMHWRMFNQLIDRAQEYEEASIGFGLAHFLSRFRSP